MDASEAPLRALMQHEEKVQMRLSSESLQVTLKGLALLSRHFRRDLDELETHTYIQGLRGIPPAKLEKAITRALETMRNMPVIADLRELADSIPAEEAPAKMGRYCEECYPDGYVLVTSPTCGYPYKVARRCPCQRRES